MQKIMILPFIIVLLVVTMSCVEKNDEPTPPAPDTPIISEDTIPVPVLPDKFEKPILFETENMSWLTEYSSNTNVYHTKISYGTIDYVVKSEDIPNDMIVTHIIKEQDGQKKAFNVNKIREISDSNNGFYEYEIDLLNFNYSEKGKFEITLDEAASEDYNYRNYYIILQSKDSKYGTQIMIEDILVQDVGRFPINFDLSKLKYTVKRNYDETTGNWAGSEYSIDLPSDECELELPSQNNYYIAKVSLFNASTQKDATLYEFVYNWDYDQTHELNQPLDVIVTEYGEFATDKENESGATTFRSKIFKNTGGQERIITVRLDGSNCYGIINFIQAAK